MTRATSTPRRWAADLLMGVRFAVAGGREGWARTALTAVGVGLGVTVLLVAASIPHLTNARDARELARVTDVPSETVNASAETALLAGNYTEYHGETVRGILLQPDGESPPVPPGVDAVPGPGEMVASPALARLLGSEEGELLRERIPWDIVGGISKAGLSTPHELTYYAGSRQLSVEDGTAKRFAEFGFSPRRDGLEPMLLLLVIVGCVTLLLPVAAFVAAAVRFGGERRDRRLAALRLVGADARMTRRVAAGEAMAGALLGLAAGGALFLVLRRFVDDFRVWGFSAFPSDVTPTLLPALLIVLAVPACAVTVSLLALRRVTIEPLGVVRNAATGRRRLWWRLVPPVIGTGILLLSDLGNGPRPTYLIAGGVVLVLVGVTALLPWLVEATVRRVRGGRLPFQLAVRRLQLDSGTAARAVSGITVAVAGAVALQMLFGGVAAQETQATGRGDGWADVLVYVPDSDTARLGEFVDRMEHTTGVRRTAGTRSGIVMEAGKAESGALRTEFTVAECAVLRGYADISRCRQGDVFILAAESRTPDEQPPGPGTTLDLRTPALLPLGQSPAPDPVLWTVPEDARTVQPEQNPSGYRSFGLLVTPAALGAVEMPSGAAEIFVRLEPGSRDAVEHVRNTAASFGLGAHTTRFETHRTSDDFAAVEQALYVGAVAILLLIGASLVVSTVEGLRERKRLLSVLVAFGTRRATLVWSVLWQTTVPVALGLAVAAATGIGLGAVLMRLAGLPFAVDWAGLGGMTALGGLLVALVTLLSLPVLWRLMRPDGLRTE